MRLQNRLTRARRARFIATGVTLTLALGAYLNTISATIASTTASAA